MAYKMKGSPFLKDIKLYEGSGSQVSVDDTNLGKEYMDEHGNKARDYTYTTKDGKKATDVFYLSKPRFEGSKWKGGPKTPSDRPIDPERFFA